MRILYPAHPLYPTRADELFEGESSAARVAGFAVSMVSLEDSYKIKPALEPLEVVLYRGWMLRQADYSVLAEEVARAGARMFTSTEQYLSTHHLPKWYGLLEEWTPHTQFFADAQGALQALEPNWPGPLFVKDWVKSLSTGSGPIARKPGDLLEIARQMQHYRGSVEGGLCVRDFEVFQPETEERYFVARGRVFARAQDIPDPVKIAAQRVSSDFFCVDVATRQDGVLRIIELGDGQVSDLKGWTLEEFMKVLEQLK